MDMLPVEMPRSYRSVIEAMRARLASSMRAPAGLSGLLTAMSLVPDETRRPSLSRPGSQPFATPASRTALGLVRSSMARDEMRGDL
ncbi:hypothetical protein ADK70_04785 [Streptomyces rimosus subsp. pseudoverticillatus]|nr:hypothetical protein ADK70_04785 [Streptomyces rimosus subsp. pseudoverticillatus]